MIKHCTPWNANSVISYWKKSRTTTKFFTLMNLIHKANNLIIWSKWWWDIKKSISGYLLIKTLRHKVSYLLKGRFPCTKKPSEIRKFSGRNKKLSARVQLFQISCTKISALTNHMRSFYHESNFLSEKFLVHGNRLSMFV